jgi:hypothetical protein
MKYSQEFLKQQAMRRERLRKTSNMSSRKVEAQSLAKQGLAQTDPLPIQRDLEADLQDETLNISTAQKNTKRLIDDLKEASILLNELRENDLISDFNSMFPKIYSEVKSKYDILTGIQAFNVVYDIMTNANEPISNKNFMQALQGMYREIRNDLKKHEMLRKKNNYSKMN